MKYVYLFVFMLKFKKCELMCGNLLQNLRAVICAATFLLTSSFFRSHERIIMATFTVGCRCCWPSSSVETLNGTRSTNRHEEGQPLLSSFVDSPTEGLIE